MIFAFLISSEVFVTEILAYITQPKALMIFMIILMAVLELRAGYFRNFIPYLKTLKPAPYVLILLLSGACVLCVTFADEAILRYLRELGPGLLKDVLIPVGGYLGKFYGLWLILAGLCLLFFIFKKRDIAACFFSATLASALSGLLAHIIKHLFQRARPFTDNGPYHFFDLPGLLTSAREFQSFPSGDVAVVAGAIGYLFLILKGNPLRYLLLVLPVLTGFSRVANNKHWPSDALLAIGIGFAAGYFMHQFRLYAKRKREAPE